MPGFYLLVFVNFPPFLLGRVGIHLSEANFSVPWDTLLAILFRGGWHPYLFGSDPLVGKAVSMCNWLLGSLGLESPNLNMMVQVQPPLIVDLNVFRSAAPANP